MIELIQQVDTSRIEDLDLRHCVEGRLHLLPADFIYPEYGYFIVLESVSELYHPLALSYGDTPLVERPLDYVELVEEDEECFDVVLLLHADFGVELIIKKSLLSPIEADRLRRFKEF